MLLKYETDFGGKVRKGGLFWVFWRFWVKSTDTKTQNTLYCNALLRSQACSCHTQEAHSGTWIFVDVYMNFMIQKRYNSRVRLSLAVYNSYQKKKALIPQSQSPFCYQQSSFRFHPLMTAWSLCRLVFIAFSNFLSCSFSEIRGRKRARCVLRIALVPLPACWDLPFMYFFNAFCVSWPSYADPCLSVPYASCFRAHKNSDERTTN